MPANTPNPNQPGATPTITPRGTDVANSHYEFKNHPPGAAPTRDQLNVASGLARSHGDLLRDDVIVGAKETAKNPRSGFQIQADFDLVTHEGKITISNPRQNVSRVHTLPSGLREKEWKKIKEVLHQGGNVRNRQDAQREFNRVNAKVAQILQQRPAELRADTWVGQGSIDLGPDAAHQFHYQLDPVTGRGEIALTGLPDGGQVVLQITQGLTEKMRDELVQAMKLAQNGELNKAVQQFLKVAASLHYQGNGDLGLLRNATIRNIDLTGINLAGVDLTGVTFEGCKLHNAVFMGSTLNDTTFTKCSLENVNMSHAKANRMKNFACSFRELDLSNSEARGWTYDDKSKFLGAEGSGQKAGGLFNIRGTQLSEDSTLSQEFAVKDREWIIKNRKNILFDTTTTFSSVEPLSSPNPSDRERAAHAKSEERANALNAKIHENLSKASVAVGRSDPKVKGLSYDEGIAIITDSPSNISVGFGPDHTVVGTITGALSLVSRQPTQGNQLEPEQAHVVEHNERGEETWEGSLPIRDAVASALRRSRPNLYTA